jgi:AraC-like DNA-binding protein
VQELDIALRVAVVSQLLFIVVLLVRAGWPLSRARTLAIALVAGVAVYMYCSYGTHEPSAISIPLIGLCILIPPLFWLFASAAFDDIYMWRPWHALVLSGALGVGLTAFLLASSPLGLALGLLSRVVSLAFVLAALWIALRNRTADLVEGRRKFRAWLTGVIDLYMLEVIAAEIALLGREPTPIVSTLNVAAILVVSHLACHGLSMARANALESIPTPVPKPKGPKDEDQELLARLTKAMEDECLYRKNGLSIAELATMLSTGEHALRRLINERLGFRNFNDFLNRYRVRDACRRLRAPETTKLPVLTIAIDVGYNSIAPFNRAFKELLGMTPTAYREAKQPPSI